MAAARLILTEDPRMADKAWSSSVKFFVTEGHRADWPVLVYTAMNLRMNFLTSWMNISPSRTPVHGISYVFYLRKDVDEVLGQAERLNWIRSLWFHSVPVWNYRTYI
jgi:hypothetical protein